MLNKANITWTAKVIAKMAADEKLRFDNVIQRSYVWEVERKSELIHSMLEGYPIPPFYAKRVDGKVYDFLDGKQRIDAIRGYINGAYALKGIAPIEYNGEMVDLNGMYITGLNEELQDRIKDYNLVIYYFDGITPDETRILFRKLNNGKPLSAKEKAIANCTDVVKISNIGSHEFFKTVLSEKALDARKQIPLVMKMWMMLNMDIEDVSFEAKQFNEVMQNTAVTDEAKNEIVTVLDKMMMVYNSLDENDKLDKAARKRIGTETHLVSLAPFIKKAIDEGISDELIADFVREAFAKEVVSPAYLEVSKQGGNKNSSIKIRNSELQKLWDEFFKVDDEPAVNEPTEGTADGGKGDNELSFV